MKKRSATDKRLDKPGAEMKAADLRRISAGTVTPPDGYPPPP
jgi:hypothetical protein